jgi:hypothetical protein
MAFGKIIKDIQDEEGDLKKFYHSYLNKEKNPEKRKKKV